MIYPCIIFLVPPEKEAALFSFDRKGDMGGPYVVKGWYEHFKDIGEDKCIFGFCTFLDGTKFISMQEHHERLVNGEDSRLGVFNLFCNSFGCTTGVPMDSLGKFKIWKPQMDHRHKQRIYTYATGMFAHALKVGLDKDGLMMRKGELHLGCKLQGDELDFFFKRMEPTLN